MLEKYNFHWKEGFFYGFPKKRELFNKLINEIKSRQIISITGLRRTGKSTLLRQLIDYLILSEKVTRENILLYSFDEEQPKIEDVIRIYEAKTGKDIFNERDRLYIFLDEVQKLNNWQNQVKYYYDNYLNIKFFISGSSSLFIKKRALESLAGRIYEFTLSPLTFREFLIFRDKSELIGKPELFEDEIKKELFSYQKRQFIEIINETEERTANYVKTIIEKIVYQDIPKIFPIENEELLMKIIKIVASNPGLLSNYLSLSNELGISRVTLSNYFFYLEEAFLLKRLYNFSRNMISSEKKMKKFYLTSTSFFALLNNDIEESKLVENLVVSSVDTKFFWRTPQQYEVDIILSKDNIITPVEVKWTDNILQKDLKNILRFSKKFGCPESLVLTKNREELKLIDNMELHFIPLWKWFLFYK